MKYFAAVVCRCGKSKLQLTSTGYHKLLVAAIQWGKSGNTTLAIPGHDPPFEITIFNDVALNPGPVTSLLNGNQVRAGHRVMAEHCAENVLRLQPQAYSRQQLMDLRWHCCFPSSTTITLLKQCGIFKFRGRRGGRNRRIQRHYANFPVRSRPLFRRAVNPENLVPIQKGPSQVSTPTSCHFNFCLLNTRSVKNKTMKVKDFVVDHDIDILAITETWLRPGNIDEVDIGTLCPSGYGFLHVPRSYSNGGGVGLLFKEALHVSTFDPVISDYSAVNINLLLQKPQFKKKTITYRKLHSIDYNTFCNDITTLVVRSSCTYQATYNYSSSISTLVFD